MCVCVLVSFAVYCAVGLILLFVSGSLASKRARLNAAGGETANWGLLVHLLISEVSYSFTKRMKADDRRLLFC